MPSTRYHASIGAQPLAGRTDHESAVSDRTAGVRRRRSVAARGLALAALAALLAGALIWVQAPSGTASSVFASWQRVPTAADPSLLRWALQNCPITGALRTYPTTLVLQDQRGKAAYFVFVEGDDFSTCLGADPTGSGRHRPRVADRSSTRAIRSNGPAASQPGGTSRGSTSSAVRPARTAWR